MPPKFARHLPWWSVEASNNYYIEDYLSKLSHRIKKNCHHQCKTLMFVSLYFRADFFNFANWSQEWYLERSEEAQASKLIYAYGSCMLMITFAFPCFTKDIWGILSNFLFPYLPISQLIQTLFWSISVGKKRTSLAYMKEEALLATSGGFWTCCMKTWHSISGWEDFQRWYDRNRYPNTGFCGVMPRKSAWFGMI